MFISKNLLFLEMQKTGGSHILKLLKNLTEGESIGKHNRLDNEHESRFVFGSIRNPWDWYVSLWAYGVGGKGAIRTRVVKGVDLDYYYRGLPKSMGKNWLTIGQYFQVMRHDLIKPTKEWASVYKDSENAADFRRWLQMLLDPARRFDIGEGFAFSPLSTHCGLMTYRYLRLFTPGLAIYSDKRLSRFDGIAEFDRQYNISGGMIRTENLEDDFIEILRSAGHEFTQEQIDTIKSAAKTNISKRKQVNYYYDQETLDLVARREKYVINKFGYSAPTLDSEA